MLRPLRVLIVEDNPADAELVLRVLRRAGFEPDWDRVDGEQEYLSRLQTELDIIISDYAMPQFSGPRALELLKEAGMEVPFIIVSGTIGEDVAVEVMKLGATDYLLKDRLTRLGLAVEHAIKQAQSAKERKRAEESLRLSEERFRQLADNIHEVFWITDVAKNNVLYISPAYEVIWGRTCDSLFEHPRDWLDSIHPDDRARVLEAATTKQKNGTYNEEYRITRPDGSIRWIHDRAFPVRDATGEIYRITGVAQDISDRRLAELKLREQASLLDKAQDAILVRDLDHRITYWNKSAERLYGWSAGEACGRSALELIYPDKEKFNEALGVLIETGEWVGEVRQINKSGSEVLVAGRWTLVRDDDGEPKSVLAINTDITEKKQIEAQFLRAQRLESIGTLAGGIAHDLNNVLTPITMSIDILKGKVTDEKSQDMLAMIAESAKRGAEMVGQVLSFARGVEGRRVEIQARHVIVDVVKIAKETFPKNIQIRTAVPPDLWTLQGDPTQLHQVLLNLLVNARDALPIGGQITISAGNKVLDAQYAAMNIEAKTGPHVLIEVKDTGTGIPAEIIGKIFDPFFTTKEVGKGTGLGLSTSLAIVRSHGGFVRVNSEEDAGTTFQIYLPSLGEVLGASPDVSDVAMPGGNGQTVLVVDDEDPIRQITRQTLEANGYKVMLASDGAEAVAVYARHKAEIDIVLTDMMMPFMDGASTIQVLLKMNPKLRIIAASGLAPGGAAADVVVKGAKQFLPKPYTSDTLLRAIHQSLRS